MLGNGFGMTADLDRAAASAANYIPALATLVMPLAARYSAQYSTVAASAGLVTSISDLVGGFTMVPAGGSTVAFTDYTDWRGRKAFRGEMYSGPTPPSQTVQMKTAVGLTKTGTNWNQSMVYYFVYSSHRVTAGGPMVNGMDGSGVTLSNGPAVGAVASGILRSHTRTATDGRLVPGTNLQVVIVRTTATNVRIWRNGVAETVTGAPGSQSATGFFGQLIGGANMAWDLYEYGCALSSSGYTDANMDTDGQALMTAYGIVTETRTSGAVGDSILAGFKLVGSGDSLPMKVRESLPAYNRHINYGVSGDTTALVFARIANILTSYTPAHPCLYELAIGVNDASSRSAQDIFNGSGAGTNNIISIANTILAAGAQAKFMSIVNIACANGLQFGVLATNTPNVRDLIRSSALLTETNSQSGGANDGRVTRADYTGFTVGGSTIVATQADAGNSTYWQSDGLHPNIATNVLLAPTQAANITAYLG